MVKTDEKYRHHDKRYDEKERFLKKKKVEKSGNKKSKNK